MLENALRSAIMRIQKQIRGYSMNEEMKMMVNVIIEEMGDSLAES